MEVHELAEKIRTARENKQVTNELVYESIDWCNSHTDEMDLSNKDYDYIYNYIVRCMMGTKQLRVWDEKSFNVIVNYLAKDCLKNWSLNHTTSIKILDKEEYEKRNGGKSNAVCVPHDDDTYTIEYSPTVKTMVLSGNSAQILRGLQIVFHEIVHALQNTKIKKDVPSPEGYLMALETIARKQAPEIYDENWSSMLKENHAEKIGLNMAIIYIKNFAPDLYKLYDQEEIENKMKEYDVRYYDGKIDVYGKSKKGIAQIDKACSIYVSLHPEIIKTYPVLHYGFNLDGTKKTLKQLLEERKELIEQGKSVEGVNKFYATLANYKNYVKDTPGGTKEELLYLREYILETGTDDEFIYGLMEYRLRNNTKMESDKIEGFVQGYRNSAAKIRSERKEQNIIGEDIGKAGVTASVIECDKIARDINTMQQTKENIHE